MKEEILEMGNGQHSPEAPYDDATIYFGTSVRAVEPEGEGVETQVSSQGQPLVSDPEKEKTDPTVKLTESPKGTVDKIGPSSPPIPAHPVDDQHGKGEPIGKGQEQVDDPEPQYGKGEECVDDQEPQHVQGQETHDECVAETTGLSDADLEKYFASLPETHLDLRNFAVLPHFP